MSVEATNELTAIFNLEIKKGVDLNLKTYWKDETGALILGLDLWTGKMQLRSTVDSEVVLIELTTANGGLVMGASDGEVEIVVTDTQSASFNFSTAEYDILLTDSLGVVYPYLMGDVTIIKSVTR